MRMDVELNERFSLGVGGMPVEIGNSKTQIKSNSTQRYFWVDPTYRHNLSALKGSP